MADDMICVCTWCQLEFPNTDAGVVHMRAVHPDIPPIDFTEPYRIRAHGIEPDPTSWSAQIAAARKDGARSAIAWLRAGEGDYFIGDFRDGGNTGEDDVLRWAPTLDDPEEVFAAYLATQEASTTA